ncbi:MAG: transposase [Pseudomonadales bacterium]
MPRRFRGSLPNIPHHIIQRGNNRSACFYGEENYLLFLEWLSCYAKETDCELHAYVRMTNHVHLLITSAR